MDPATTRPGDAGRPGGRRWLRSDEGWIPSEDVTRIAAAVGIALGAVAVKYVVVGVLGGELGYLSYLGAVALGAWIAGLWGGLAATAICAAGQTILFPSASGPLSTPYWAFNLGLFLLDGVLVSVLSSRLRRAYVREHDARTMGEADLAATAGAHRAADRDRADLATLQAVTASLSGARTPVEVADAILDRGLVALGAVAGGVSRVCDEGDAVEVIAVRGYPGSEAGTIVELDRPSHLREAITSRRPVFLPDLATWVARFPESPPRDLPGSSADGGAIAVLPLVAGSRTLGAVVFRFGGDRDFDDGVRDLATRLAEQGAQALDRALAWDQDRRSRDALERGQRRLALLVGASDILGTADDVLTGIAGLPALIVPALADWCAVELLDGAASGPAVGAQPGMEDVVERLAHAAPRSLGSWLVPASAEAGATIVSTSDGWLDVMADRGAAALLVELGSQALLAAPISSAAGEPLGSIVLGGSGAASFGPDDRALVGDIAARIAAAAERSSLFAAVTRFKATVDVSADAVYMFDPNSLRLTYVNRGGGDLLWSEPATLVGTSVLDLQPGVSERVFRARLADLAETSGSSVTYSGVLARVDGSDFPGEILLQEVTLPDGAQTVILTARDISERIDVQARLARIAGDERRKAAELQAVIQSMGEGVLVVDPDGQVSMANDAAGLILGADLAEALASVERRLAEATHRNPDADGDARGDAGGTIQLEDGRWIEVTNYAADLGTGVGARSSRIVVLRDVSRARDAEAAREAFLGVLSHELRTPVTTIYGYSKVMRRPAQAAQQSEMLGEIEAEADRLYRIVEDLLALSRVEAGISIEGEPVLVQHLVRPVVASEAERWRQVEFETRLPTDLPAVFGDRTYVEQVIRNLTSNAGKYGTPGTTVTVEAEETDDEVVVRVLDRGIGVAPEEAGRLFDLFYRSPQSARTASGAGIGLYVSRGLISAMGGRIWVLPRDGGGSEFGFTLPRYREEEDRSER